MFWLCVLHSLSNHLWPPNTGWAWWGWSAFPMTTLTNAAHLSLQAAMNSFGIIFMLPLKSYFVIFLQTTPLYSLLTEACSSSAQVKQNAEQPLLAQFVVPQFRLIFCCTMGSKDSSKGPLPPSLQHSTGSSRTMACDIKTLSKTLPRGITGRLSSRSWNPPLAPHTAFNNTRCNFSMELNTGI